MIRIILGIIYLVISDMLLHILETISYVMLITLPRTLSFPRASTLKNSNIDETFYLYLPMRHRDDLVDLNTQQTLLYHYAGNKICPDHKQTKRHAYRSTSYSAQPIQLPATMTHSSCPSHLRLNYDTYREPQYILEAACNCDKCYKNYKGNCQPVKYPRKVMRTNPWNGVSQWKLEEIAVGCTCVYPEMDKGKR